MSETPRIPETLFDDIVAHTFAIVDYLAVVKGGEYAHAGDRLDNFRRQARDLDLCMEQTWRIYAGKHWDAITTYIRDMQTGRNRPRSEPITGRVDDLIVYLILFKAILYERGQYTIPPKGEWPERPATTLEDQLKQVVLAGQGPPVPISKPSIGERIGALKKANAPLLGDNDFPRTEKEPSP